MAEGNEDHVEHIYRDAADATGRTPSQLRATAEQVFASMLLHAMATPGEPVWTVAGIVAGRLDVEVNVPPRRPATRPGGS
jgi:hypothetical protein